MEGLQWAVQHRSRSTSGWGGQARTHGVQVDHLSSASRPRKHRCKTHPTTALFRRMRSYVVGRKLISVRAETNYQTRETLNETPDTSQLPI